MKKNTYLILGWILTLLISIIWTYENPEKIKSVKNKLKLYVPKNDFKKLDDDKKIKVIIERGIKLQLSFFETDFNLSTVNIDFLVYRSFITGGIKYFSS